MRFGRCGIPGRLGFRLELPFRNPGPSNLQNPGQARVYGVLPKAAISEVSRRNSLSFPQNPSMMSHIKSQLSRQCYCTGSVVRPGAR